MGVNQQQLRSVSQQERNTTAGDEDRRCSQKTQRSPAWTRRRSAVPFRSEAMLARAEAVSVSAAPTQSFNLGQTAVVQSDRTHQIQNVIEQDRRGLPPSVQTRQVRQHTAMNGAGQVRVQSLGRDSQPIVLLHPDGQRLHQCGKVDRHVRRFCRSQQRTSTVPCRVGRTK